MIKDNKLYFIHIIEAIFKIEKYIEGKKELFFEDEETHDAVVKVLQNLAESTSKLPKDFKEKNNSIEWDKIYGFRNILVHDYIYGTDINRVWNVIEIFIPILFEVIKKDYPELVELVFNRRNKKE